MPDITMCTNTTCPIRNTCYRFTATVTQERQSWANFQYEESIYEGEEGQCKDYWPIDDL